MDYIVEMIKYIFVALTLGLIIPGLFSLLLGDRPWHRFLGFFAFTIPILLAIFFYPPIFREIGIASNSPTDWLILHNRTQIWFFITYFTTTIVALAMLQNEKTESIGVAFFTILSYFLFTAPVFFSGIISSIIGTIVGSWITTHSLANTPNLLELAVHKGLPIGVFVSLAFLCIAYLIQRLSDNNFLDWDDAPRQSCCYLLISLLAASIWGGINAGITTGSIIGGLIGIVAGSLVGLFVAGRVLLSF